MKNNKKDSVTRDQYDKSMRRIIMFSDILAKTKRLTNAQIKGYEKSIEESYKIKRAYEKERRGSL